MPGAARAARRQARRGGRGAARAAKRELAEEIGKGAREWKELTALLVVAGFADEGLHLFLATGLYDETPKPRRTSGSRSSPCRWPSSTTLIAECEDAKTLIGLLWFRSFERGS